MSLFRNIIFCLFFASILTKSQAIENGVENEDLQPLVEDQVLDLSKSQISSLKVENTAKEQNVSTQRIGNIFIPLLPIFKPITIGIGVNKPPVQVLQINDECSKDSLICSNLCYKVGRNSGIFLSNPNPSLSNPDDGNCLCQCTAIEDISNKICNSPSLNAVSRNSTCSTFCRQNDHFKYSGGSCQGLDCICGCYLYDPYDASSTWNWSN